MSENEQKNEDPAEERDEFQGETIEEVKEEIKQAFSEYLDRAINQLQEESHGIEGFTFDGSWNRWKFKIAVKVIKIPVSLLELLKTPKNCAECYSHDCTERAHPYNPKSNTYTT